MNQVLNNDAAQTWLIDTHCHLDFDDFGHDRQQVLTDANAAGVHAIVVPAVSAGRWSHTLELCQNARACYMALGLHPIFIEQHQPQHLNDLATLIQQRPHKLLAVGEIGLDFYHKTSSADGTISQNGATAENREKQLAYFSKQLIIAKRAQLPAIIHNRKAHDECIALLQEHGLSGGIIHAFNGSLQQAHKYIELGFALGFGGMLTFSRSSKLRALAEAIPLQHIVLETDAPDMTVVQHKGERNSPAYLPHVADTLASIKGVSIDTVAQQTTATARQILNF